MLAIAWVASTGEFTAGNFVLGFALGFVVLFFTRRIVGVPNYGRKVLQVLGLVGFFIWELIKANLRVAYDVLTPGLQIKPGVVMIPLDVKTDTEITVLANLISLTPGTLSLDVSADRRVLYIHEMYIDDPELVRRRIKDGFERRVIEVLR
jgi:multicomponent Na+:H+ antiporter subunit E